MRHRRAPREVAPALTRLLDGLAPQTPLAVAQRAWPQAVGSLVAGHATPTSIHDGTLTVACDAAVWAQELDLLQGDLLARLEQVAPGLGARALRCRVTGTRGWAAGGV